MIRVRGRSFIAFVLGASSPLDQWLEGFERQLDHSPAFFLGKPVVLDLTAASADDPGLTTLVPRLQKRGLRLIGIEGSERTLPGAELLGHPLSYGRNTGEVALPAAQSELGTTTAAAPAFLLHDAPVLRP